MGSYMFSHRKCISMSFSALEPLEIFNTTVCADCIVRFILPAFLRFDQNHLLKNYADCQRFNFIFKYMTKRWCTHMAKQKSTYICKKSHKLNLIKLKRFAICLTVDVVNFWKMNSTDNNDFFLNEWLLFMIQQFFSLALFVYIF